MNDTHPKIAALQLELLRSLAPEERFERAMRFSSGILKLSREQFAQAHGELGLQRWLEAHYGMALARGALGDQYRE